MLIMTEAIHLVWGEEARSKPEACRKVLGILTTIEPAEFSAFEGQRYVDPARSTSACLEPLCREACERGSAWTVMHRRCRGINQGTLRIVRAFLKRLRLIARPRSGMSS